MYGGRRVRWLFILSALVVIGLVIWAVNRANHQLPPPRQLANGSVVTISKVTYGRELRFPLGNFWQKIAGRFLPDSLSQRLRLPVAIVTNAADTTFFVIETLRTNDTFSGTIFGHFSGLSFSGLPQLETEVHVADDAGNEFELFHPKLQFMKSSNVLVEAFSVPMASHLATHLSLRVFQHYQGLGNRTLSTTFVVPNPAPHSKPRWNPAHLPMTNQLDDLTVVLSEVARISAGRRTFDNGETDNEPASRAKLKFFEHGAPSTNWRLSPDLDGFTIADEEGHVLLGFDGYYSPKEPRKMRFELVHFFPSRPEDILTFTNVTVPDSDDVSSAPVSARFQGYTIELHASRKQYDFSISPRLTNFIASLTVAFTDKDGREHKIWDAIDATTTLGSGGLDQLPKDVKSINLTFKFTATTNRFVEFIALPEPAPTNSPANRE